MVPRVSHCVVIGSSVDVARLAKGNASNGLLGSESPRVANGYDFFQQYLYRACMICSQSTVDLVIGMGARSSRGR
ncbi:MAG: hypothetical protein MI725_13435 [Pirellulales bacterium]|nr:hypothetical protein [Pirellulales bacterium]